MTRREWLCGAAASRLAARRPNVVLMVADDLGSADLSSYGCQDIRTPRIDSIGARGVRFTHFYANGPECSPTRTALLTGRYQQRVGGLECAIGVGDVGRYDDAEWLQKRGELGLPASEITLPQVLKQAGYATGCFGKWHLGYPEKFWPIRHGFDESFGILGGNADYFTHREEDGRPVLYHNARIVERTGYTTDLIAQAAVEWLARQRARPFFLYVTFTTPHTPIQDPDGLDPATGTAPVRQGNRKVYAKMVERMDTRVGDILEQLEHGGAAENTTVIFISDNGADPNGSNGRLRGRKGTLWEGGIRIPCLMRWPGVLPEGKDVPQVGITMDLMPTLQAAVGAAEPRKLDGVDLLPVLRGQRAAFPRSLFWRYKRAERVRKAAREGNWKLVIDQGQEELHDLGADEFEVRPAPANRLAAEKRERLRGLLAAWEREVMAPRLRPFRTTPG